MDILAILNGLATAVGLNNAANAATPAPGATDYLTQIPGAATAVNYIRRQLVKLQGVPGRLSALERAARQLQGVAQQKANAAAAADLARVTGDLPALRLKYQDTAGQVAGVMLDLNAAGFAAVPVELAFKAISLAASLVTLFDDVDKAEKRLAGAAARLGVPVPAGVPAGLDAGRLLKWGAIAAGGIAAVRAFSRK